MQQQALKYSLFLLLIASCYQNIQAQNTSAQPETGIQQLTDLFKEIPFTNEQQNELMGKTIELVFLIDETGDAELTEIKGIQNKAILDSFYRQQATLPKFIPAIQNGKPIVSYFILEIAFKSTRNNGNVYNKRLPFLGSFKKEDFEFVKTRKGRFESLLSLTTTGHIGDVANQFQMGLGFKIDFLYIGKSGLGGGITANIFSNQIKERDIEPAITEFWSVFDQSDVSLLGGVFMYWPDWQFLSKGEIGFQAEMNLVNRRFSIADQLQRGRVNGLFASGMSPALGINYSLKFGKERYQNSLFFDSEVTYHLNIHATVRPMLTGFLDRGAFFELGIGLRSQSRIVKDYKWKN